MFTPKDYLNDLELKTIVNPLLTEELKAVLIGEPTKSIEANYARQLVESGLLSKKNLEGLVSKIVAIEEAATALMEGS